MFVNRSAAAFGNHKDRADVLLDTFLVSGVLAGLSLWITVGMPVGAQSATVFAAVLTSRRLFAGVLLLCFLLAGEAGLLTTSGVALTRYLGGWVAFVWVLQMLAGGKSFHFRARALPYLAYFGWALLSLCWSSVPQESFQIASTYLQLALLLVILLDQLRSGEHVKQAILALAAGSILILALFVLKGRFATGGRLVLNFDNDMGIGLAFYGYPLAFSMTLLAMIAVLGKGKLRIVAFVSCVLCLYPLIGTGLRGAMLCMAAGTAVAGLVSSGNRARALAVSTFLVAVYFGAVCLFWRGDVLPPELIERLTLSSAVESRGSERLDIWRLIFDVIPEQPLIGLGLNQFGGHVYRKGLFSINVGTHNDYLEALVSLGLIGAALLILGEVITLIGLLRVRRHVPSEDRVWHGALIAVLIASIVGQNFVNQAMWKYVWIIRALAIAASYPEIWRRSGSKSLWVLAPLSRLPSVGRQ